MTRIKMLCLCAAITIAATVAACSSGSGPDNFRIASATQTIVVTPIAHNNWLFYQDWNSGGFVEGPDNSLGSFVSGPGTPPAGTGSVEISVTGISRPNLATYQFGGTTLADITELKYSTYNASAGNGGSANRAGYLQFNVDFNGSDTWQRRLHFLPKDNGTVDQDTWQEWDTLNSGNALWRWSGGNNWPDGHVGATRTWSDILAAFPGVRIRVNDPHLSIRVGEPYPDGYTENIDAFVIGINGNTTTYDFEESSTKDDCKKGGWEAMGFKNQGECVSAHVSKGKK